MGMKGLAVGVVLLGGAGGGYWYADQQAQAYADTAAQSIKQVIEAQSDGVVVEFASVDGDVFSRSAVIDGVRITDRYDPDAVLTIERLRLQGDAQTLAKMTLQNAVLGDGAGTTVRLGELSAEKISVDDLSWLQALLIEDGSAVHEAAVASLAARLGRLNTGDIRALDLQVSSTGEAAGEMKLAEFAIDGISNGKIARMAWQGLALDVSDQEFEAFTLGNFSISGLELFYLTEDNLQLGQARGYGITEALIENVRIVAVGNAEEAMTIKRLAISDVERSGEVVTAMESGVENLVLPLSMMAKSDPASALMMRQALGQDTFDMTAKVSYRLGLASGEIEQALALGVAGLGAIEQSSRFTGIPSKAMQTVIETQDEQVMAEAMEKVRFSAFSLSYDDDTLADQLLETLGDRNELAAMAELQMRQAVTDAKLADELAEAVRAFVRGAEHFSLKVEADPAIPVMDMESLAASGTLTEQLKVSIVGR